MRLVQRLKFFNVGVELYLLHNKRTARCKRLNLGCGKCYLSCILGLTSYALAVHYLIDEVLLSLKYIPKSCVKASFGNICEALNLSVDIALTESSTVSLLYVSRSPRCVKMMYSYNTLLCVHTNAHFTGGADKHSYLALVHVTKQLLFLCVCVCLVDKGYFLCRNTALTEFCLDVVIELCALHIHLDILGLGSVCIALALRSCHIAEDKLCSLDGLAFVVCLDNVLCAAIDFTALLIRKRGIYHTLSIGDLSTVRCNLEHIILRGIYVLDIVCSVFKLLHICLLELSALTYDYVYLATLHCRDFKAGYIGQHVCKVAEQKLKLTHILET